MFYVLSNIDVYRLYRVLLCIIIIIIIIIITNKIMVMTNIFVTASKYS
jgi:hypothetical protein